MHMAPHSLFDVRSRSTRGLWILVVPLIILASLTLPALQSVASGAPVTNKYVPVTPLRLVDTRIGLGIERIDEHTWRVDATGVDGIPDDATAVAVSMVATNASGTGYLLTYPSGDSVPNSSNLNFQSSRAYSTGAIVGLSANGKFDVFTSTAVDLAVDVTGAFVPSGATTTGRFKPSDDPKRVFDSRSGSPLGAGDVARISMKGRVPGDAQAALVTLTSTGPNASGYFTAWADGAMPNTSTLNVGSPNSSRATTAIVPLSSATVQVFSSAGGHLIVDLVGYFTGPSAWSTDRGLYVPTTPQRRLDTRQSAPLQAQESRSFDAPGGGVAVGSLTMLNPAGRGYATAWANGSPRPETSSINLTDGTVIANFVATKVSGSGVALFSSIPSNYLFDQFGYFTNPDADVTVDIVPETPVAPRPPGGPATPGAPTAPTAIPTPPPAGPTPDSGCSVSALLVPSCGAWLGTSLSDSSGGYDFARGLREYEEVAQNQPDIVHMYKRDAQVFPSRTDRAVSERPGRPRSVLFINWKPSTSRTWRQVADGAVDADIAKIAEGIKAYPYKFYLTVWHEPENDIRGAGSGFTTSDYAAMYRHVVTELRSLGVTNAVYVWNMMGFSRYHDIFDDLYPGDDVVDWIAWDPYSLKDGIADMAGLVTYSGVRGYNGFYDWATRKAPGKPLMLAEFGFHTGGNPNYAAAFRGGAAQMAASFPAIKAFVYWNENGSVTRQRIDQNRSLGDAFRTFANDPYFNQTPADAAP